MLGLFRFAVPAVLAFMLCAGAALALGSALPDRGVLALTMLTSYRYGTTDIRLLDIRASRLVSLTHSPAIAEGMPVWSPDGTRLAFVSYLESTQEIVVVDATGDNARVVYRADFVDGLVGAPLWSPAGDSLLFPINRVEGSGSIMVVSTAGGEAWELTGDRAVYDVVVWSPEGDKIAFEAAMNGNSDVFVMDADGANIHNVSNDPSSYDGVPSWSPDGSRVVFSSTRGGEYGMYEVAPEGGDIRYINHHILLNPLLWSPDGRWALFDSARPPKPGLFVLNAACLARPCVDKAVQLTEFGSAALHPSWSPDGETIAFISTRFDSFPRVYLMRAACITQPDGCESGVWRAADAMTALYAPSWKPG
jgi:TolB protein